MRKNSMIFISYIDSENATSGSRLRPKEMLKGFKEQGLHVLTLTGDQYAPSRKKDIQKLLTQIKTEKPAFCYIESPTYPIMKHRDRKLIKQLHRQGIKIGYFYRDFYRKFPMRSGRRSISRAMKDKLLDFLQWRTDRVLRYCDIVYFPSEQCKELFSFKDMRSLPPAGENHLPSVPKPVNYTCIYVGGIVGHYDGKLLLDTFEELAKRDNRYKLILVCRKDEWDRLDHPAKQAEWLEVHHTSGDELAALYGRAQIGLVSQRADNQYNKYVIPVKTFEYMSYGLPIVSVNVEALAGFIEQVDIGLVVHASPSDFADGIQKILENDCYSEYCRRISQKLLTQNLWSHRAQSVIRDLGSLEKQNG